MPTFKQAIELPHPVERVFSWHRRPGAFERLIPPFEDVRLIGRSGDLTNGGTVTLGVKKAGIRVRWHLRHTEFEENGPFAAWEHRHRFTPTESGHCVLEEEVKWEPPLGALGELMGGGVAQRELRRLFDFRHARLANDLARHASAPAGSGPLTVAITGQSGLVGRALTSFLESGGHRVIRMVRRRPPEGSADVYWDYRREVIDLEGLAGADAVVHLAGEPLSEGRWDADKKRRIHESRSKGTRFLSDSLVRVRPRPRVLVSSSAVGFYGDRGNQRLVEGSPPGKGFLAEVCKDWEAATSSAEQAGIRVVHLRAGVVISGEGGALEPMLLPFKMGAGGRLGRGDQYISWIDHDDLVGLIHHALVHPSLGGPLNGTAPHAVTNGTFTGTLGRVLNRPTLIPVPSLAIKALFGEKGRALLLEGARVLPKKAEDSGFRFFFPGLEESLRFQLGRPA
jgi:uncharacterized protein (TIGR01777 family)